MNIRSLLSAFLVISFCSTGFCQKIKYKDLYVLLSAKKYDEAEPFLKKYLKDNDDNPNAYLYMGITYHEKMSKIDVLKETDHLISVIDSAVYFYTKANAGMTEKEVSKNDDYYAMYHRRDIRTGEFGVKLSDVKLDLETRMKIKDKAAILKMLKAEFLDAESYYAKARKLFTQVQAVYPGAKEFYLRADDKLIGDLSHLAKLYDSCHISFNNYKEASQSYGKTGYNQDLDPTEIRDFKKDGNTDVNFYKDDLIVWDYKRWALSSLETIEREIRPLNDGLVAHDKELNLLLQKLYKDSVSVREQLAGLMAKPFSVLTRIDPQPLPLKVFELKESEIEYGNKVVEDRPVRDSLNMVLQVKALRSEYKMARKIDSLGGVLINRNLAEETENYKHFVTTAYGDLPALTTQIRTSREFGTREMVKKEAQLKHKEVALMWILDGKDSIPVAPSANSGKFKPLVTKEEVFTAGLRYLDSLPSGYYYAITPSRKPQSKSSYSVDQQVFKKRFLAFTKALTTQDEPGSVNFLVIYSEIKVNEKYPATIVRINKVEGLAWSVNYGFTQLPSELVYSVDSSELSVKTRNAAGELSGVVFDKNGKEVK